MAAAKAWRRDAQVALGEGRLRAPSPTTVSQAAETWLTGVCDGSIRNRSGDRYKPSAIRTYDIALKRRVLPALGANRLSELRVTDVQEFADRLLAAGTDASTIRNTLMPLRAIYRRHLARGDIAVNPTTGLELPAVRSGLPRIPSVDEAATLILAVPQRDRGLWATAAYAGLRCGELRGLRWEDVDLAAGIIRVRRSWDMKEGAVEPKSRAGRRRVPIAAILRDFVVEHKMDGSGAGLVFGRTPQHPFTPTFIQKRADVAWANAGLARVTLHELRHVFASVMIDAGVNIKALSTFMGHSSITVTLDRYGHLLPGSEDEAAALLDTYLERASTKARLAAAA